uniref:Uncharacterized protein n=1 Tax=Elaeophora elaphi TaxID=1147741 RepID=A0A0R3RJQ4_9BILA
MASYKHERRKQFFPLSFLKLYRPNFNYSFPISDKFYDASRNESPRISAEIVQPQRVSSQFTSASGNLARLPATNPSAASERLGHIIPVERTIYNGRKVPLTAR